MDNCIVYIGDFDFRNENVQAHLVRNNGKILNRLGFHVEYIGINRAVSSFRELPLLSPYSLNDGNGYLELPDTLNTAGLLKAGKVCKTITDKLDEIKRSYAVSYVISYQSPTYAVAVKKIAVWCKKNGVKYIVNCADLPTFDLQSPIRKAVMKINWDYLHRINKKYADGVIAVSKFIQDFYSKPGRASTVLPPLFNSCKAEPDFTSNNIATFVYAGIPFKITGREANPEGMKDRLDKVIDLFLRLSEIGSEYVFNIIGISKEDYLSGVPRHIKPLENETKIRFLGRHSHAETLKTVSNADFSINFRDENLMTKAGFSTKIVESVSLGTPVIINSISDTFDYLSHGVTGFLLTGDLTDDTLMLKQLCEKSIEERLNLKRQCRDAKIFSIEKYQDKFNDFLNSLRKETK